MKIAVVQRRRAALSVRLYRDAIVRELDGADVAFVPFDVSAGAPADADLVWEPSLAGTVGPLAGCRALGKPVVATVHGAGSFTLSSRDLGGGPHRAAIRVFTKRRTLARWRWFRRQVAGVIAVSQFGKQEIVDVFGIPSEAVTVIHHGVDLERFTPAGATIDTERPYFLHVSAYQPLKNLSRIVAAYQRMDEAGRPDLLAVVPGYRGPQPTVKGLRIVTDRVPIESLPRYYRGAVALVFCSLRESFGMPILEAMASGCPVITSDSSGCAEVAGEAAMLVDPRSVDDIAAAMRRMFADPQKRDSLRRAGMIRAGRFTWAISAARHLAVFRRAAGESV